LSGFHPQWCGGNIQEATLTQTEVRDEKPCVLTTSFISALKYN